jgi:sigma-B regulation protein RsbU (phosphoserine phosphatase)
MSLVLQKQFRVLIVPIGNMESAALFAIITAILLILLYFIRKYEKARQDSSHLKVELELERTRQAKLEILDQLEDGYVETDTKGIITHLNLPFLQELGYDRREEVMGKHFTQIIQAKYANGAREMLAQIFRKNRALEQFNTKYVRNDGKLFVGEGKFSPLLEGDVIIGCKATIRNVTLRSHAEKELAFQKDFLDALLHQAPIAIVIINKENLISHVNPAFQKLFGYAQEEVIGKSLDQYLSSPEIHKEMKEYSQNRSSEPLYITGQRQRKDGSMTEVEVFVQPFFAGSINYGHLVFYNDISERRKAEEDLIATTTAYRAVLDTLRDPYFEADAAGYLTYVNQAFVEATQYTDRDELIGKHFRHLVARESRMGFFQEFKKFYTSDQGLKPLEINYLTKDGAEFSSEIVASPILEDGEVVGTRGIVRDISLRVKAEEILRQAKVSAEQALDVAERDLEIGREIQLGFFPQEMPEIPNWEIATFFKAARQVSGDFYDVFPIYHTPFTCMVVADVCDKGVGAAMFMVLLRSLIRSNSERFQQDEPSQMVLHMAQSVNQYIVHTHGQSNMFATLVLGILDPAARRLYYVNGGHDAPLLIDARGNTKQALESTGPAFGFTTDLNFEAGSIDFGPGDVLLAYTDGFTEARNASGEFYGDERFAGEAAGEWTSAFSAVRHLELSVFSHMADQPQADDLTLLALRLNRKNEAPRHGLTLKAEMEHLSSFRQFAGEVCQLLRLKDQVCDPVKIIVDELCSNIILHGYKDGKRGNIRLIIEKDKEHLVITVVDQGQAFDPAVLKDPPLGEDIHERRIGGLGVFLVRELVDQMDYERKNDSNRLSVKIKLDINQKNT